MMIIDNSKYPNKCKGINLFCATTVSGLLIALASCDLMVGAGTNTATVTREATHIPYTFTPEASKTLTVTKEATPTQEAYDFEKMDVFYHTTWPEKEKIFWETGWLNSSETERAEFQKFMEKLRASFYEKKGITEEVAALTDIKKELRTLHGMIYYVQHNIEEVKENQYFVPVSPREFEFILMDKSVAGYWHYSIPDPSNPGMPLYEYGLEAPYGVPEYNLFSSEVVGKIAGNNDPLIIPRNPYDYIWGDLGAIGVIGSGESASKVFLMNVLGQDGFHNLLAPTVSLDTEMILPKGSICITGESPGLGDPLPKEEAIFSLPEDYKIGQFSASIERIFDILGRNTGVEMDYVNLTYYFNISFMFKCLHPELRVDMGTSLSWLSPQPSSPTNWPWSK